MSRVSRATQARAAKDKDSAGVKVPPPLIYMLGLLAGVGIEQIASTPKLPGPIALAAAGAGIAASIYLDGGALRNFLRVGTAAEPWKPSSKLVTTGPYRFTRNPMYLGMACLYVGASLAFGYLWSAALLPVVLFIVDRQVIAREERYLERRFGKAYRDYKRDVRRWL